MSYAEAFGKWALVTGASSGIGEALAKVHAANGGNLILVARSKDKLMTLRDEIQRKFNTIVEVVSVDLSEPGAADLIYAFTQSAEIEIDYLINNAGFGGHGKFSEREASADRDMIAVNIGAVTNLMHCYVPGMVQRDFGRVLNVSSSASMMPGPLQAVYYATKSYVTSLSQAVAEELSDTSVTVTALCPGFVDTGFADASDLNGIAALKETGAAKSPSDVAFCGYDGMMRGDLVTFNEAGLKFMLNWVTPLIPRKRLLKMSRGFMEK